MSQLLPFKDPKNVKYFPNLNGVRFIAAFSVLFHHLEQVKEVFGLPNMYHHYFIKNMGKLGVGLFFVLSGFLITYLLLQERGKYGNVSAKDFYVRRMLRIWPLYFLIVLLSFFVFPEISLFHEANHDTYYYDANIYKRLSLFMLVLPNLAMIFYGSPYLCSQTWSIGVEEQFYLLWPWIVMSTGLIQFLKPIFTYILGLVLLFWFYMTFVTGTGSDWAQMKTTILFFLSQFRILTMVIGGLGAYLIYHDKQTILQVLYRREVQWLVYSVLILMLATGVNIPGFNLETYGLFFCYFIVNVASNPKSIISLEQPVVHYLGKISYGLYIYHIAVTVVCINVMNRLLGNTLPMLPYNIILYTATILLSVGVAALSFRYFEKPFLTIKDRFNRHGAPAPVPAKTPTRSDVV